MRPPRRPLAALVLTGALAVAGCGDDSERANAYVEEVRTAQQLFVTRFDQVLKRLKPTSTAMQDRATLESFSVETARLTEALDKVEPPEDVQAQHRNLVAAVDAFSERLARAGRQTGSGGKRDRARARTELSSSVADTQRRITRAITEINAGLRG